MSEYGRVYIERGNIITNSLTRCYFTPPQKNENLFIRDLVEWDIL